MAVKKARKPARQYVDKNPIESFKDLGDDFVRSVVDEGRNSVNDLWNQLLGGEGRKASAGQGELQEGQELDLKSLRDLPKEEKQALEAIMPGFDYRREIVEGEKKIAREDTQVIEAQIHEIIIELKKLVSSTKELEIEFKDIVVEQKIEKPGKYHVGFFEWVLSAVKLARMKVEDSQNWLNVFKSKKSQKQYWSMFKKHGTTFGLSNERTVSTQTG